MGLPCWSIIKPIRKSVTNKPLLPLFDFDSSNIINLSSLCVCVDNFIIIQLHILKLELLNCKGGLSTLYPKESHSFYPRGISLIFLPTCLPLDTIKTQIASCFRIPYRSTAVSCSMSHGNVRT